MDEDDLMLTVIGIYNGRAAAATGLDGAGHTFSTPEQWGMTTLGLDVDADKLLALAETMADQMSDTVIEHRDRARMVLVDGLRQLFVMGAMHEQERARREAAAAEPDDAEPDYDAEPGEHRAQREAEEQDRIRRERER